MMPETPASSRASSSATALGRILFSGCPLGMIHRWVSRDVMRSTCGVLPISMTGSAANCFRSLTIPNSYARPHEGGAGIMVSASRSSTLNLEEVSASGERMPSPRRLRQRMSAQLAMDNLIANIPGETVESMGEFDQLLAWSLVGDILGRTGVQALARRRPKLEACASVRTSAF